ncbi:MAG: DUF3999 family protein [Candidatus Aquilonibacter sp.]
MIAGMLLAAAVNVSARAIVLAPREHPTWALLALPQDVDPGDDQRYGDLRIVDDLERETPYVIDPACRSLPSISATVSDLGFVAGSYTQATIDAGTSGQLYDDVTLETSRSTFFTRVRAAISDDRVTWREVRTDALIYRVANSNDPGTQTITFSPARARWIRVRVLETRAPFPIEGASLDLVAPQQNDHNYALAAKTKMAYSRESSVSTITFDLHAPNTSARQARVETTQPEFVRDVTVEASNDGSQWDTVGNGTIARFAQGSPNMEIALASMERYVRVHIANQSDPPLENLRVTLYGPRRYLVFIAAPHRSYAIERRPEAAEPQYDLSELLAHDSPRHFLIASAEEHALREEPQRVPGYRTIPQNLVMTLAFTFAIVTLGVITLVTLRPRP